MLDVENINHMPTSLCQQNQIYLTIILLGN